MNARSTADAEVLNLATGGAIRATAPDGGRAVGWYRQCIRGHNTSGGAVLFKRHCSPEGTVTPNVDRQQPYEDRRHAGIVLAQRLQHLRGPRVVVLALPRGGVPVAHEVARALDAPLDVFLVRKLGVPGHRELAMGAIASGGVRVLNQDVIAMYRLPTSAIDAVAHEEQIELERRERTYREARAPLDLRDRVVLLIDDGLATGSTMQAAVEAVRAYDPARIVVGVPVGSPDTCRKLADIADEIVCARAPEHFAAVGQWYRDFSATSDEEVRQLLREHTEPATRTR